MEAISETRIVRIGASEPLEFADRLAPLVSESIDEGFNMLRRLVDDFVSGKNRFDKPGEAVFTVVGLDDRVLAVGGLNQYPFADEPTVGRVRRVYVLADFRRRGLGRSLMASIIEEARARGYSAVVLRTDNETASQFYVSLGFKMVVDDKLSTHRLSLKAAVGDNLRLRRRR